MFLKILFRHNMSLFAGGISPIHSLHHDLSPRCQMFALILPNYWSFQCTHSLPCLIFFLLSGDLLISSLGFLILILQHWSEFFPIVKRLLWQIWPILDFPSCKSYHFYIVIVFCDIIYNIFTSLFCCFTCSKSYGKLTWEYQCSAYVYRISWSKVSLSWFYNWIERNFYLIHVVSSSYSEKPPWEGRGDPLQ